MLIVWGQRVDPFNQDPDVVLDLVTKIQGDSVF
jgi:hypothetical protein